MYVLWMHPATPWSFSVNAQGLCGYCSQIFICSYSKRLSFSARDDMQSAKEDGSPCAEDWDSVHSPPCIMTSQ